MLGASRIIVAKSICYFRSGSLVAKNRPKRISGRNQILLGLHDLAKASVDCRRFVQQPTSMLFGINDRAHERLEVSDL